MRVRPWLCGSALAIVLLVLVPACASKTAGAPAQTSAVSTSGDPSALVGKQAPDFSLVDQFAKPQKLSDYQGKVVLLTFVSSHCTTVCPLTAEMLARTQDLLGAKAKSLQVVAVNANPVFRSVGAVMAWSKLHSMTNRWQFLTGSADALSSVYVNYDITPGSQHTILVYLIDAHGEVRSVVPVAAKNTLDKEARVLAKYVGQLETS